MLYKKIHRQHVKQFRIGRKFWFDYKYCEVIREPFISEACGRNERYSYIQICYSHSPIGGDRNTLYLISMTSGRLCHPNEITLVR